MIRHRRILYVCNPRPGQTSGYRLRSLRRLCPEVAAFDTSTYKPRSRYLAAAAFRMPVGPFIYRINRDLLKRVREFKPDVVLFDKPIQFTRETILAIRRTGAQTVCYNQDGPFSPLFNEGCWHQFYKVYRLFDLHCLFREADVQRYKDSNLPWIKTMFSFEPTVHFPPPREWTDLQRDRGVSYIGSPFDDRPTFLQQLGDQYRQPVVISGPRWRKFIPPDVFSRLVADNYLADSEYREAIWRSRINLSFVTKFHQDDISHKAIEIAACQGFLLALRTAGHQACFDEDKEAVFFSDIDECADKCRFYLDKPELREVIARRGRERAVRSGYDNDTQLARILNHLDGRETD